MKISHWVLNACFLGALVTALPAFAQDDFPEDIAPPGPQVPILPNTTARVYAAEENNLGALQAVLARGSGPGAVSLNASEEAFSANAGARAALLRYVSQGGTVFLHTGAAREFGFTTVEAREGTNQLAGQLYGRARAAMPFGAHPLLWDDGAPARPSPNSDPTQLPGVNVIYYQLRPGDHLVVSHPAGTPLLVVSDLAVNSPQPLYAAAVAPFGRGFAVFAPDVVDLKRADGALFARNLLGLLGPAVGVGRKWVGIPARAIEGQAGPAALQAALRQAMQNAGPAFVPALPGLGTVPPIPQTAVSVPPAPDAEGDDAAEAPPEVAPQIGAVTPADAQILLGRAEAANTIAMLGAGGSRAGVASNLLLARLAMMRGDGIAATRFLEAGAELAPQGSADEAAIALWRGVLSAGISQPIAQSSTIRAQQLAEAARDLGFAATRMGFTDTANPDENPNAPGRASEAGLTPALVQNWAAKCAQISQIFALEPPGVRQYGIGEGAITLRGFPGDATIDFVDLGVQALARAGNFGWRADREEVLVFPTLQSFTLYRRALGLGTATVPLPAGSAGDVLGQRLIMVGVPSFPLVETDQDTGERRVFAGGNNTVSVFARLHSYILLNALDEGGTGVPVYLQLGIENIVNRTIDPLRLADDTRILEQFAQNGGLLTPNQFVANQTDPIRYQLAQLQASGIVAYFYNQYGPGGMVETLQRLGAGQTIDDALLATTEGDELDLFQNWRDAQFGPRRFPNRG